MGLTFAGHGSDEKRVELTQWFSVGATFPVSGVWGHWARSGDIFDCHTVGQGWHRLQLVRRGQDGAEHPTMHRMYLASSKGLSSLKFPG